MRWQASLKAGRRRFFYLLKIRESTMICVRKG